MRGEQKVSRPIMGFTSVLSVSGINKLYGFIVGLYNGSCNFTSLQSPLNLFTLRFLYPLSYYLHTVLTRDHGLLKSLSSCDSTN